MNEQTSFPALSLVVRSSANPHKRVEKYTDESIKLKNKTYYFGFVVEHTETKKLCLKYQVLMSRCVPPTNDGQ